MNIGIIAPSPVPFCIGGAEKLFWGLLEAINNNTPHHAELIKLPSREQSFFELLETYKNFASLDISHFDLIISTKYPAWMAAHPNHYVYMLHKLRGLYDTYPHLLPMNYEASLPLVKTLKEYIALSCGDRRCLVYFWELLSYLHEDVDCKNPLLSFPGALIREIVHYLDNVGLNPEYIRRYMAISKNVVNRRKYFPENTKIEVIYPPSNLKYYKYGKYEHFFTVSRLDSAKRVALLVEAMRLVKADIPLYIAGTGPDEEYIKSLGEGDRRIKFLGFVSDEEVIELYSNALAVPYIPYDEDYGLVTIEAMMSRKPVLTFSDSGGVNEFVEDGKTGYSVEPSISALATKMELLASSKDDAKSMGNAGYNKVKHITWENTVNRVLQEPSSSSKNFSYSPIKKKKLVIAVTFPIYPPMGGGQLRIYHLYKNLTEHWDVDIVSLARYGEERITHEIVPGMREIRIPISQEHWLEECNYTQKLGVPVTDVIMPLLYKKSPEYVEAFTEAANSTDILVASHPYFVDLIIDINTKRLPVLYEAHNVEYFLKKSILPSSELGITLLEEVKKAEAKSCEAACFIFATSQEDAVTIKEFYGASDKRIDVIPNGVDTRDIPFIEKKAFNLKNGGSFIFIGSWHGPNIEAMYEIFNLAKSLPNIEFQIAGSVCNANDQETPSNVRMLGILSDAEKLEALSSADFLINPMISGSGTNLKMLEAFSIGLPVLCTPCGARGFDVEDGKHLFIRELKDFKQGITDILKLSQSKLERMRRFSRNMVENKYDWRIIAKKLNLELTNRLRGG